MEHVTKHQMRADDEKRVPSESPRVLRAERFAKKERIAAYRRHPENHVRRDPNNPSRVVGSEMWANGGAGGRVL